MSEDHVLTITRAVTHCGECMFLNRKDTSNWCLYFDVELEVDNYWGGERLYIACEKCRRLIR